MLYYYPGSDNMLTEVKFKKPIDISEADARIYLAIKLFEEHRVSLEKAAEIAEYPLDMFIELLSKKNIPVIDYPVEELKEDIRNA
jgi:predicted HTH domain antitoxin